MKWLKDREYIPLVLLTIAMVVGFSLIAIGVYEKSKTYMPEQFRVWVKVTGNTNDLTYGEWLILMREKKSWL